MRRKETVYQDDTLGQRLVKFIALLVVVFGIVAAVVVTQRLSDDALALVIGLLIAGIPLLAIVGLLAVILWKISQRQTQRYSQPPQQTTIPPIILQMPQQQPQLPQHNNTWDAPNLNTRERAWDVIGDGE